MEKIKCASFFAGVGGIDKGFETANDFEIVYANEFDKYAALTYELNSKIKIDQRDIRNICAEEIPDFDVLLAGFPCQSFSIAGHRHGFKDAKGRGTLFFEVVRIVKTKKPKIVFLENVKNLVTHDDGNTFAVILDTLTQLGYHIKYKVLNAMEYGNIPQNRERIYIIGFLDEKQYNKFEFPDAVPLTTQLSDIIDFHTKLNEKYYYTPGKYKGDIYDKLVEAMDDDRAVYQWRRQYVRKNKSGVVPTLTANQGMGGHNVCLIKTDNGIRKMTPRECFNAQGFPEWFSLPRNISDGHLYKQAGNSVCVPVIQRIASNILKAFN
jgi:DNA (cytosine-5)-methyltransferase 1